MGRPAGMPRTGDGHARGTVVSAALLGALASIALALTLGLSRTGARGLPCLFRTAFHLPCPGCGMTRSLSCIWGGEITTAARYHPLGPLVFAALAVVAVGGAAYALLPASRSWIAHRVAMLRDRRVAWTVLTALIGVWVARMADAAMGSRVFLW